MRIVFATEYYPPFAPGGSPWSIQLLAAALAARGHVVRVVTPDWGPLARAAEPPGVTIARFPVHFTLPSSNALAPARILASPAFHWRMARAVLAEGRRAQAEVVHAQDKHALVGAFLAARRLRRPVFLTLRDTGLLCPIATCLLGEDFVPADCSATKLQRACAPFFLDHYIRGGQARRWRTRVSLAVLYADARAKRALVNRLDGLVSVSRGLLEIYLRAGYGRPAAAHVVYTLPPPSHEVDAAAVQALRGRLGLAGRRTVLYSGKISLGKGGPVFLEAARRVAARHPDATFLVAGPDVPAPAGDGVDVRWLGRVPHHEMATLYSAVDLVVVPSVGPEALSRVPLEAAAAGRPTVGARAGGIPEEILDGETGRLVPRGDADALAGAVGELLADDARRTALGDNARRFLGQRFDPQGIVEALLEVYRTAQR
jgi:glycosyltransferase involved in cell wall biosynthesis